jgi:hypothetical protein
MVTVDNGMNAKRMLTVMTGSFPRAIDNDHLSIVRELILSHHGFQTLRRIAVLRERI